MSDRLQDGQRLNVNDKLVSANGVYTLFMQGDGHLVLYKGQIDASTAYWGTSTYLLPANERPTYALMQGDAHFVLYDANGVPRWSSGTWGPGYVDPYLMLENDGTLVIYHSGTQPVWATSIVRGKGEFPARGYLPAPPVVTGPIITGPIGPVVIDVPLPAPAGGELNSAIDRLGRMPPVVTGSTSLGKSSKPIDGSGVAYTLTEEKLELVSEVVEHAFLQDIGAMGVWPGQVIQSRALLSGDVAPIGPFPRQPGTIQITTDLISNTPRPQSVSINDPDAAKVNNARRDLVNTINPADAPGLLKTSYERAYTMREVGVKVGLSVKGSSFSVNADATFDESYKSTVVVAVIRQVFYSATFTPQSGGASGFWPDGQVSYQNLAPYVGAGNPPLYVDSVQYGRFICVTVKGSFSSTDITIALKASYESAVKVGGSLDFKSKSVLESSEVKIYTIGVPGYGNFQGISSVEDLQNVFKSGRSFSPQNPGAPISFTCRHIADNSLAKVRLAAEYTKPLSAVGADISRSGIPVYDGPGGGFVDTQIRVNPGDYVKISAGGTIWSGVFASQPHGPEGWLPNHKADPQAPMPLARTYCLLHRFGTGSQGWIETGALWEGAVPPVSGGTLQLTINDPNTQNGDPKYKWSVSVDVKRAGAGAVGIYV
jgi:hypothetical protein